MQPSSDLHETTLPSSDRIRGAIFRHVLRNRFPGILLPRDFRLLVQMRRGSSVSFIMTASLAYAIKNGIKYRWTPKYIEFARSSRSRFPDGSRDWPVAAAYDARSLAFRRAPIHTTHFPSMISTRKSGKAFVRLRNPYDQFRSHSASLAMQIPGCDATGQAFEYLTRFVHGLESASGPDVLIATAETYFSDKATQLQDCFDFFEIADMSESIVEAVSVYSAFEDRWNAQPPAALVVDGERTPRTSYQAVSEGISDECRQRIDQLVQSTVFSDFYPTSA